MRTLRAVVLSLLIVVVVLIGFSYLSGSAWLRIPGDRPVAVGTTGTGSVFSGRRPQSSG